jgi:glycosyltransferase involved in cell wall biosynthesis
MKINIASHGGRSHLLDIARELEKFGHEVRFYSFVPTKRAMKFGLKKKCNKTYFLLALPFLALQKLTHRSFWSIYIFHRFFDIYVALTMKPCDVFVGHSPVHVYALKRAKKKYNATLILECGTSHLLTMVKILESIPINKGKCVTPNVFIKRAEKGYELTDYISIPSDFARQSFLENGIQDSKLFVSPYGVSLNHFYPTNKPNKDSYDVIIVGQWGYRKSCDLLTEACLHILGKKLLHVGSVVDCPLPNHPLFTHVDAVDEPQLLSYYTQAKTFALPSREDGFGLVLSQALICGLPVVCSKNTGGRDLRNFLDDKKWIIEMPELTAECLAACIREALQLAVSQPEGKRNYAGDAIKNLTWEAHGKRYNDFIKNITKK